MKCNSCQHENTEGAHFCAHCGAILAVAEDREGSLIGQTVGSRYLVTRVLGEGGMGIVYEAEQRMGTTTRKVALKTLHKHLSQDPAVKARFNRECGVIAELEHPNTVKVYDFGSTPDGVLYIAMEFLNGRPLGDLIREAGPLAPSRVIHIARQITGSLAEAHGKGIIHRDLKPENVVLIERAGEKDVVKLLDFGIAARTESADAAKERKLTQQGMVLGTPPYMSPEQFTGKELDPRTDIYSLAIVIYEMLTCDNPFSADTAWQWATEHMTAVPRLLSATSGVGNIPQAMCDAVMKALSKDREHRQANVSEFFRDLSSSAPASVAVGMASSVSATGATALMEAPPDFGAGQAPAVAATADMPQVVPVASRVAPAQLSGSRGEGGKAVGNRGLMLGLMSGGALILGIAGFVMTRQKGDTRENAAPLFREPAATTIAPLDEPAAVAPAIQPTLVTDAPSAAGRPPKADAAKPSDGKDAKPAGTATTSGAPLPPTQPAGQTPAPSPTPQPTSQPAPVPAATAAPPPKAPAKDPKQCEKCISLAQQGDIAGAASAYSRCSAPADQQRCQGIAKAKAGRAAQAAQKSGDCARVRVIAAAAGAMGATSSLLTKSLAACN